MDMKVVVMCCVLNEERNIERFCQIYSQIADVIVLCDGGSTDRTVELANQYAKVDIVRFGKVKDFDGIPANPLGPMHNFGYKVALNHKPEWVITDEADSLPTIYLQENVLRFMETTKKDVIGAGRLYILGSSMYFPDLSLKGYFGWAHRPEKVNGWYGETKFAGIPRPDFPHPEGPYSDRWLKLDEPSGLLHYGWPSQAVIDFKTERYRANGALPPQGTAIPSNAGEVERLPEWATWT
jgi:glycosyltransferase involved in cell wall biosynthesis